MDPRIQKRFRFCKLFLRKGRPKVGSTHAYYGWVQVSWICGSRSRFSMLFISLATNIQTSIVPITTLHCCLPLQSNISCSVASPVCIDSSTSPSRVIWAEAASMHTANTMRQLLSCRVCTRLSGTKHCINDGYQRICFGCTCTWSMKLVKTSSSH